MARARLRAAPTLEVFADFVLICASFLAAYVLAVGGMGTEYERSVYLSALPILLGARYVFFVALGVYRRVWRYATRDVVPIVIGCFGSAVVAYLILVALRPIGSFPAVQIFVIDAILCTVSSAPRASLRLWPETLAQRGERKRVLVVGAGRAGRSLARELREEHDERVVGFWTTTRASAGGASSGSACSKPGRDRSRDRVVASGRGARDDPRRAAGPARCGGAGGRGGGHSVPDGETPRRALCARAGRGRRT